ncbi:MAG: hypothetical protein J0M03_22130 [Acidobacteria bacterium]|nr:hypothetical protein [Acidobacteriota bacterium]
MAINFNNIGRMLDLPINQADNKPATQNLNQSSGVDSIGFLPKVKDILSLGSKLFPKLGSNTTSLTPRAGFPENPLSFDNLKYLLKLVAGTIPLTSKLTPDLKNDGKLEQYPKGQNLPTVPKVYAVNGIATNELTRADMGNKTAQFLNKNVNFINNSTEGPAIDLLQCAKELFLGIPTKPTETLANAIYKDLTKNPPEKLQLVGYSQGTIMTTHAVSLAITKMKENGYSDSQIKQLMSENVRVALTGCPVDLTNPGHVVGNVPPGPRTASSKTIGDYFTTEDIFLSGKGEPYGTKINREQGPGELSRPNFEMLRHDKDVVATVIHDFGADDIQSLKSNPGKFLGKLGSQILSQTLASVRDTLNPFGYHMYDNVYLAYMVDHKLVD